MMLLRLLFVVCCLFLSAFTAPPTPTWLTFNGTVHFKSNAPLELIEAASNALKGVIDFNKKTFSFNIEMSSFQGFNSPLQRQHFNENYLETRKYPKASFTGKIIEKTDFSTDGEYTIRAKGKLEIHGVTQERIIKSKVRVAKGKLYVSAQFSVLLKEHQITIPKIVYQKIAEEINVSVEAEFSKQ